MKHVLESTNRGAAHRAGSASDEAQPPLRANFLAHLHSTRMQLQAEWCRRIVHAQLLSPLTHQEIFSEAAAALDRYLAAFARGGGSALRECSDYLQARVDARGVRTVDVIGTVLLLRDLLGRSLFQRFRHADREPALFASGAESASAEPGHRPVLGTVPTAQSKFEFSQV